MQRILPVLHGNQAVAHQKVFVALVLDDLLQLVAVHFARRGVRVLARAGVLAAVCDVFGRFVELGKTLLSQLFIHFEEPVRVKAPVVEFFGRQRRVSGDHGLLAIVKPLVHVGHEVVAAAGKAVNAKDRFRHLHPLRRVHGHFDQAVRADLILFDGLLQIRRRLTGGRPADFEQVGQRLLLARPAAVRIISVAVQGVRSHRAQDLHKARDAFDPRDAADGVREYRRRVAAPQFHVQNEVYDILVDFSAHHVEAALRVHGPLIKIYRHVGLHRPKHVDGDVWPEQIAEAPHRVLQPHQLKSRLVEEIPGDQSQFMGLYIVQDREDIVAAPAVARIRIVRVEPIDPVRVIEQGEYAGKFLVALIAGSAGQQSPEFVRTNEAERGPVLQVVNLGRGPLHPPDVFGKLRRHKDRRPRHLGGKDQILLTGDDLQDRLVRAVRLTPAHVLGVVVMVARIGLSEDRLLRLEVRRDVLYIRLIIAASRRVIQVEEDFGLLDDRLVDFDPQLREGISGLDPAAVIVAGHIQAVLQQLFLAVYTGVLEFSVRHDKGSDRVKISIELTRTQTEIVSKNLRGLIFRGRAAHNLLEELSKESSLPALRTFCFLKSRHIVRRRVIQAVPFLVQDTSGAFAPRDLRVEDLLLIRQAFVAWNNFEKDGSARFFAGVALFAPAL